MPGNASMLAEQPMAAWSPTQCNHPRPQLKPCTVNAAKNIILAGVKRVMLHDSEDVHLSDLGANFYLSETDVGRNRTEACLDKLRELNTAVAVECVSGPLDDSMLTDVDVRASWTSLSLACAERPIVWWVTSCAARAGGSAHSVDAG